MTSPFLPGLGAVFNADIAVPDRDRVVAFYAGVLPTGARPQWREDLSSASGLPIIGIGTQEAAYAALPVQWMPHLQVADVAASAAAATEGGGRVLLQDEEASAWAVAVDPQGAAFGLVPVAPWPDAEAASSGSAPVGRIVGLSLTAADPAAAAAYYEAVLGCSVAPDDASGAWPAACALQGTEGQTIARIRPAEASATPLPAVWLLHLPVGDLDESLVRVWDGGGAVLHVARGADERALLAVIRDPAGGALVLEAAA